MGVSSPANRRGPIRWCLFGTAHAAPRAPISRTDNEERQRSDRSSQCPITNRRLVAHVRTVVGDRSNACRCARDASTAGTGSPPALGPVQDCDPGRHQHPLRIVAATTAFTEHRGRQRRQPDPTKSVSTHTPRRPSAARHPPAEPDEEGTDRERLHNKAFDVQKRHHVKDTLKPLQRSPDYPLPGSAAGPVRPRNACFPAAGPASSADKRTSKAVPRPRGAAVRARDDQPRHHSVDREEGGEHRHGGQAWLTADRSASACAAPGVATTGT